MKKLKLIASTLVVASVLALSPIGVSAEWGKTSNGWKYTEGMVYVIGWKQIDSKWYYFDSNRIMKTGWLLDGGKWYYFYGSGEMAFNTKIDGYYLNVDGVWSQNSSGNTNNISNTASENGNEQIVTFSNKYLEEKIREAAGKPKGDLYKRDVEKITELIVEGNNPYVQYTHSDSSQHMDISGIESLTNLQHLDLAGNKISDISAIKGLTNLQYLNLGDNQISDINAIRGLTNLKELVLYRNKITDISDIEGLNNLQTLNLSSNQISGINAVKELTNLQKLDLSLNKISDISVIKGLTNLKRLELSSNQISDTEKQLLKNAFPTIFLSY